MELMDERVEGWLSMEENERVAIAMDKARTDPAVRRAMERLWRKLFKTDKETFARCLSISGHGNSSQSGKLIPPVMYPAGINELGYLITLHLIVVLGTFYHRRVL